MIRRLIRWLDDSEARQASQLLTKRRIRQERALVRETARAMRTQGGMPPDPRLAS